jgi:hypothetical protein
MLPYYSALKCLTVVFLAVHFPFVFSQQDDNMTGSDNAALNGFADDGILMSNYNALREEGQGFFLNEAIISYATPDNPMISVVILDWWCDFEFLSDGNYGYVGRQVSYFLGSNLDDINAQGIDMSLLKKEASSISAIFIPKLGIFEGQTHPTHDDNNVKRFWDDGNLTFPIIGWKGHDEGDTTTRISADDADSSSSSSSSNDWSEAGVSTKITTKEAAIYLDMIEQYMSIDESNLTPETCRKQYKEAWDKTHKPTGPINNITMTAAALEEEVAQLKVDNSELMSRVTAIEESLAAGRDGGSRWWWW